MAVQINVFVLFLCQPWSPVHVVIGLLLRFARTFNVLSFVKLKKISLWSYVTNSHWCCFLLVVWLSCKLYVAMVKIKILIIYNIMFSGVSRTIWVIIQFSAVFCVWDWLTVTDHECDGFCLSCRGSHWYSMGCWAKMRGRPTAPRFSTWQRWRPSSATWLSSSPPRARRVFPNSAPRISALSPPTGNK